MGGIKRFVNRMTAIFVSANMIKISFLWGF